MSFELRTLGLRRSSFMSPTLIILFVVSFRYLLLRESEKFTSHVRGL